MDLGASSEVHADYHQFFLMPPGHFPPRPPGAGNGLVDPLHGGAIVHTGIAAGPVVVTVQTRASTPPSRDAGGWDDVVEVSIVGATGPLAVVSLLGAPNALPPLTDAGGDYRVRVHARGRNAHIDSVVSAPSEHYLVQIWPAPPAAPVTYRLTDQFGAGLRHEPPG